MDGARIILDARHASGLSQRELAERAGTSQATLSTYERGLKSPSLRVTERIVEAAGFRLGLVTNVHFERHVARGVRPFWVPDRLWRGRLPECFATVVLEDHSRFQGTRRWDLRRRPQRRTFYEMLLRRGDPEELRDWIDGALLVDLWPDLRIPQAIRRAWQPAVADRRQGAGRAALVQAVGRLRTSPSVGATEPRVVGRGTLGDRADARHRVSGRVRGRATPRGGRARARPVDGLAPPAA